MGRFDNVQASIDANINQNGDQQITGSVLNAVLTDMNSASAELSEEWQKVKDENFTIQVEVLPHIPQVFVDDGGAILEADKFYNFGEVPQIAIDFAPAEEGNVPQYAFQFKCPADAATTLTMPDVIFPVESASSLKIEKGRTYQITIVNGLAVATSWEE